MVTWDVVVSPHYALVFIMGSCVHVCCKLTEALKFTKNTTNQARQVKDGTGLEPALPRCPIQHPSVPCR